jgi:FMN phosphatase YigB (HAD superfamily)
LEVKPEEALFIGDNMETDYEPASKLGMRSVLICRAGIDTKKTRGLRMITSLSELFEYID